jgi:polar amino acid transport system substrate-binding protein
MKQLLLTIVGAAIAGTLAAPVLAQSKLDEVLARGHLIVGTGSTNAPWHFKGEGDVLQGFDIDIAKIVAKGLFDDPEKVEFVLQQSDARIPNVVTDKVDITCQFMTVTAARAQQSGGRGGDRLGAAERLCRRARAPGTA